MENLAFDTINLESFQELLKDYSNVLSTKLHELDKKRYKTIPEELARKQEMQETPEMTKDQLVTLMEWKLSHGTFRPSLKALVQENDDQRVRAITRDGLSIDLIHHGNQKSAGDALDVLTQLRGVGPATASLLLSVGNPKMAPFFSDELYRWCFWQEGKGNGWDRTIKYTRKEYLALFVQVQRLRERLQLQSSSEVTAVELEKVAYVLGKRARTGNLGEVQPGHEQGGSKKRSASERDDLKLSATIDDEEDPRKNKKRPREARLNHPTAASSRPVRKR